MKKFLILCVIFTVLFINSAPQKAEAKVLNEVLNYVTPQMFGAVGNGINDDTNAIIRALKSGKTLYFSDGSYLITKDIRMNSNFLINGHNAILKSRGSARLIIDPTVTEFRISNMVFDGVAIISNDRTNGINVSVFLKNFSMKNTDIYGTLLCDVDTLDIENCIFSNIGTSKINPTYQGIGVRVNRGKNIIVRDSLFEQCRGTGGLVLRHIQELYVNHNNFLKNDYRGIALTNDRDYTLSTKGYIKDNTIEDCGVYASHRTGVGCNGIYGNLGDFSGITVLNNKISNVCENGIEGTFGLVEGNIVDGTGVDQVNHPTPSASGINMYGKVYKNNIVRNTYLPAFYVYDNQKLDGTGIKNLTIEGNIVQNSDISGTKGYAIYPVASSYTNVKITGNTTDKPLYIGKSTTFNNVLIENNTCIR